MQTKTVDIGEWQFCCFVLGNCVFKSHLRLPAGVTSPVCSGVDATPVSNEGACALFDLQSLMQSVCNVCMLEGMFIKNDIDACSNTTARFGIHIQCLHLEACKHVRYPHPPLQTSLWLSQVSMTNQLQRRWRDVLGCITFRVQASVCCVIDF